MTVYITKQAHGKYNYLANWNNPNTGAMIGQWHTTLTELKEYFKYWNPEYIKVNF